MSNFFSTIFSHKSKLTVRQVIRRRTIGSFFVLFACMAAGVWLWQRLKTQPEQAGVQKTLRKGLETNEKIFGKVFSDSHLARVYPESLAVKKVRVNGYVGLRGDVDTVTWKLQVVKAAGDTLRISLADIERLPKTDIVFDFKCIEGWSQITHWAGVRFSDFVKAYGLDDAAARNYAGLITPDKSYYVGIDMASMMQPQTILCYEMNGKPLPMNQGYPLRLIIPVKYGIKHLKRIGVLYFDNKKPPDYWAERGYDYYSGL